MEFSFTLQIHLLLPTFCMIASHISAADLESTTLINLDEGEPSSQQTMSAADFDDFLSSVTSTSPVGAAPAVEPVVAPAPATNGTHNQTPLCDTLSVSQHGS